MGMSLEQISKMTFKCSPNKNLADFSLDIKLLNVAWAMDGTRDLAAIARENDYDLEDLSKQVQKLLDMGVIQLDEAANTFVSKELVDNMIQEFAQAVGPMADVIIEDVVAKMGHRLNTLPRHKLQQLVNQLIKELPDSQSQEKFKKGLAGKMR